MVGGSIIEKTRIGNLLALWVMDAKSGDECRVFAFPSKLEPRVGDSVWWQSGKIYFNNDKNHLIKAGYSEGVR